VEIESPKGKKLRIPRRELFDIRMQLMAEDEGCSDETVNLNESDIRTNVYEGGYKSWECSFDLAKLLLDRGPRKDLDDLCRVDHVVEVCSHTSTIHPVRVVLC
jgi:protein-histidine N-methyltransferase